MAIAFAMGCIVLVPENNRAMAAPIIDWNTDNVVVGPPVDDDPNTPVPQSGASVVYDRDVTGGTNGAVTNSQVFYEAPEGAAPGIKVVNRSYELQNQTRAGAIMASGDAEPDGPPQSGKRFKHQLTGDGPTDLVFDVDPDGPDNDGADVGYQVFHRLINTFDKPLTGFSVSLGFGVGDNFTQSTAGDGLGFSDTFTFGPDRAAASTQFPFGLFGDAATNPNRDLDGFFAAERTGFNVNFSEDELDTDGFYGPYEDQFGPWLPLDQVPAGAFWDDDNDPTTDDVLMAWLNEDGLWELRREIEGDEPVTLDIPELFDSVAELEARLGVTLSEEDIEDLANLNVNYAVRLPGETGFDNFTIRLDGRPVPLPSTFAMVLGAGALGLGTARKRPRRANVK